MKGWNFYFLIMCIDNLIHAFKLLLTQLREMISLYFIFYKSEQRARFAEAAICLYGLLVVLQPTRSWKYELRRQFHAWIYNLGLLFRCGIDNQFDWVYGRLKGLQEWTANRVRISILMGLLPVSYRLEMAVYYSILFQKKI